MENHAGVFVSPKLDVLRSLAVTLVVSSHLALMLGAEHTAWPELRAFGAFGVHLFFVHTCLVLLMSLDRQSRRGGRIVWPFFIRRAFRIYPLSLLVVGVLLASRIPAGHISDHRVEPLRVDAIGAIANLGLVQDIVQSERGGSIPTTLWSLPLEMQMYATLPIVFMAVRRAGSFRVLLVGWLTFAVIGGAFKLAVDRAGTEVLAFDWGGLHVSYLPYYAPYFLAGALAFARWRSATARLPFCVLPIGVLLAVVAYALSSRLPTGNTLQAGGGYLACLALGLALPWIAEPRISWVKTLGELIARYSYGVYLTHVPCLWLAFEKLDDAPFALQTTVFAVSTVAVSALLYHAVEAPFVRHGARVACAWPDRRQDMRDAQGAH